jgi:hypothetical protein
MATFAPEHLLGLVERNPPLSVAPVHAGFEESRGTVASLPVGIKYAVMFSWPTPTHRHLAHRRDFPFNLESTII